jgi:hypothetical protein
MEVWINSGVPVPIRKETTSGSDKPKYIEL